MWWRPVRFNREIRLTPFVGNGLEFTPPPRLLAASLRQTNLHRPCGQVYSRIRPPYTMTRDSSIRYWRIAAVVYAILVVSVSSWPGISLPNVGEGDLDKLLHLIQYAVLGFLAARGWRPQRRSGTSPWLVWLPAAVLVVFAAADEFHQKWIPGRYAEVGDWVSDVLGIALGYFVGIVLNRRRAGRYMSEPGAGDSGTVSDESA